MIAVEDREAIRRAYYLEHKSIRKIAREQHHSRRTVAKDTFLSLWESRIALGNVCTWESKQLQQKQDN
jgi:hypothetical protein